MRQFDHVSFWFWINGCVFSAPLDNVSSPHVEAFSFCVGHEVLVFPVELRLRLVCVDCLSLVAGSCYTSPYATLFQEQRMLWGFRHQNSGTNIPQLSCATCGDPEVCVGCGARVHSIQTWPHASHWVRAGHPALIDENVVHAPGHDEHWGSVVSSHTETVVPHLVRVHRAPVPAFQDMFDSDWVQRITTM